MNRVMEIDTELILLCERKYEKKVALHLKEQVALGNKSILPTLLVIIKEKEVSGTILCDCTRAYFRIKRNDIHDCMPLFDLYDLKNVNLCEALLEVLGYDKMLPSKEDQVKIIEMFYHFGDNINRRFFTDPRYGLAAACAGWSNEIVESFLRYCLTIPDAPLNYVAENSLKKKYVRLR
jgi:transcription antitermination factor NusG